MSQPVRPLLGESAESRVRARRQALIGQAFEWMAAGQWRDASISQLCREVRLNKRYFYESFADLQALEDAVVADLTSELVSLGVRSAVEAEEAELDTEGLARHVLRACVGWLVEDPRRARVLFATASENPRARDLRDEVINQLAEMLNAFGTTYYQRTTEVPITEAHLHLAGLTSSVLIGGTIEAVLRWIDGKIPMSLEDLTDHLARFWVSLGDLAVDIALDDTSG
jgi:AcrR family transcriptional regulator